MSLTAFKRKSVINYGSNRSGKPPGGIWLPQGPFGPDSKMLALSLENPGPNGFSINGGHRNVGYVGKSYQMSKSGTPFRGLHPMGWGGQGGNYFQAQPVLNSQEVDTLGTQYQYIKPSTLSTRGMLEQKYRYLYNGQYPNYWVQPVYTGNQTDSASQGNYIDHLASKHTCNIKVNDDAAYVGNYIACGPTLCRPGRSTAKFKYNDMARNGPYTKNVRQATTYGGSYNLYVARKCNNPKGPQKPFPFAVQTGSSIIPRGTSVNNIGTGCNTGNIYLTPPAWYWETASNP